MAACETTDGKTDEEPRGEPREDAGDEAGDEAGQETEGREAGAGEEARQFVADLFTSFTREAVADGADPGPIVDRYYTPDAVQTADGIRINRDRLVAHIRPVRKNLSDFAFEVHEALRDGERIAARFTIHATDRRGRRSTTEVHLFGELAPDGRIRRTHQISRTVEAPGKDTEAASGKGSRS
ncbi:nuclear transport factor 2 family protein [Streptomyces synnematoformans]|uniref:SnoaL-like domain-containing protein n=1 Tax=Streptomyces synnematoformans TaxID=415721 RepID=A0ABP5KGW8_9ACTN